QRGVGSRGFPQRPEPVGREVFRAQARRIGRQALPAVRGERQARQVGARDPAGEETPGRGEVFERLFVERGAARLLVGSEWAADRVGPLVPIEAEPAEVLFGRRGHAGHGARRIEVLEPPDEGPVAAADRKPGREGGPRVAEMEEPGGGRREAAARPARVPRHPAAASGGEVGGAGAEPDGATPNSALTEGRKRTIRVKTPRIVPTGMIMQATAPTTKQKV